MLIFCPLNQEFPLNWEFPSYTYKKINIKVHIIPFIVTAASSEATPLFGTKIPLTPENMAVPDPALLAGMPPPPVLSNFGNLSINNGGMPTPPAPATPVIAPITTSENVLSSSATQQSSA